jgi:hypothetical protein
MSNYTADVLFHIDERLNDQAVGQMEYDMAFERGVRTACVNCINPHLMLVDYDPIEVKAQDLLSTLTARGLHVEMVGL